MSLYTVTEIQSENWGELPIYDDVVKRAEELAKIEKQPTFDHYPIFNGGQ